MEAQAIRDALDTFAEKKKIPTVGGMYPVVQVRAADGIMCAGFRVENCPDGPAVELTFESGRWVQRNLVRPINPVRRGISFDPQLAMSPQPTPGSNGNARN